MTALGVAGSVVLYSTPSFLLGVVLILTFSVTFRLLPTEGMFTLGRGWAESWQPRRTCCGTWCFPWQR